MRQSMKWGSFLFLLLAINFTLTAQTSTLEIGLSNVASEPDLDGIGIGAHFGYQFNKWLEVGAGITSSNAYDDERTQQRFLQGYLTGRVYLSVIPLQLGEKAYLRLGGAYNFTRERKIWLLTDTEGKEILEEAVNQWDWLGGSIHAGIGWRFSEQWSVEARSNLGGYQDARLIGDWGIYMRRSL